METINSKDLAGFFKDMPLYSKACLMDTLPANGEFHVYEFFEDKAFKFLCPHEKEEHTFKIQSKSGRMLILSGNISSPVTDKTGRVNWSFSLKALCQSCDFRMDFLINLYSEAPLVAGQAFPAIYIRKTGQFPPFERIPEREVLDYLNEEDKENYKKGLLNLSVSFGIGAFAYFRRIIENEIKKIVRDISELDFDGADVVKEAFKRYEQNHQMSQLIDTINQYIPASLKDKGDNPIRLLYEQLSGGIHTFSDDQCLEKAKFVDILLRYVIKKVNSEKFELTEVRKAMKGLRS